MVLNVSQRAHSVRVQRRLGGRAWDDATLREN